LEQLLNVPDTISDKAALAAESGTISMISANPAGGSDIYIGLKKHYVPAGQTPKVKLGDYVTKGDVLSTGPIKPQELGELKGHLAAQRYIVNEMNDVYQNKMHKRTYETIMHGLSNNAEVTHVPKGFDLPWLRGDVVPYNQTKKINRSRIAAGLEPVEIKPFFQSIDMLPGNTNDWLGRLTTNRLKDTLTQAPAVGMVSNVKGMDPLTGYLYGAEFGKDFDPKKGQWY
jgi:DNA-directed RNA polymerase subunit beta'